MRGSEAGRGSPARRSRRRGCVLPRSGRRGTPCGFRRTASARRGGGSRSHPTPFSGSRGGFRGRSLACRGPIVARLSASLGRGASGSAATGLPPAEAGGAPIFPSSHSRVGGGVGLASVLHGTCRPKSARLAGAACEAGPQRRSSNPGSKVPCGTWPRAWPRRRGREARAVGAAAVANAIHLSKSTELAGANQGASTRRQGAFHRGPDRDSTIAPRDVHKSLRLWSRVRKLSAARGKTRRARRECPAEMRLRRS